jgi:hypothetical protein
MFDPNFFDLDYLNSCSDAYCRGEELTGRKLKDVASLVLLSKIEKG